MDLVAIVSKGYFNVGKPIYYCVSLPDILVSKGIFPNIKTRKLGTKIIMDDLGLGVLTDNLVAEESIESLIPKLTIK